MSPRKKIAAATGKDGAGASHGVSGFEAEELGGLPSWVMYRPSLGATKDFHVPLVAVIELYDSKRLVR